MDNSLTRGAQCTSPRWGSGDEYTAIAESIEQGEFKVENYTKWELHANLKGVKLSAFSITEAHKNKTLAYWQKLRATNITVTELAAPELPEYEVVVKDNSRYAHEHRLTFQASSEENVKHQLARYRIYGKTFKPWQLMTAQIKLLKSA